MEVGGWVGPGLTQNSPKPVLILWSSILYHVYSVCICALLKAVSYYDLSVRSMSVMGFQKQSG